MNINIVSTIYHNIKVVNGAGFIIFTIYVPVTQLSVDQPKLLC